MADQRLEYELIATDKMSPTIKNVRGEFDKLGRQAQRTTTQAKGLSGSFGGLGSSAGRAGVQIQQLVGQVQGGTNPMFALSQQAADLGIVLGAPLVGTIAALGASLAMVLIPNLNETRKSFSDLFKELQGVSDNLMQLPPEIRDAKFAILAKDVRGAEKNVSELEQKLSAAKTALAEANLEARTNPYGGDFAAQVDTAQKTVDDLTDSLFNAKIELLIAKGAQRQFSDAVKDAVTEQRQQSQAFKESGTNFKQILPTIVAVNDSTEVTSLKLKDVNAELLRLSGFVKDSDAVLSDFEKRTLRSFESSLVGMAMGTKSVKDAFRDMATSIIEDLIRIQIRAAIVGPLSNAILSAKGTTYSTAAGYTTTGGGLTASPSAAQPSFAGGGYTGRGSRSGGVDGKGGFPAILHPNETVIDHHQGQSMGGSPINVTLNISTGVAQTVRTEIQSMLPQITNATKAAIVDAKQRGGSFARAMS